MNQSRRLLYTLLCFCTYFQLGAQGTDAGTTPDALDVTLTGAANYTLPITVPPGIRGVEPNISISFSSQAGNGLAGYGWNIGGLSTITRVGSTLHHDEVIDPVDFDNLDRFALDGQRLLLKSGTYGANGAVYQTENYSNLKVRSMGTSPFGANYGPRYFVVNYPDGSRGFYGNGGKSNGRLEWALFKWQDSQGNFIRYTYLRTGELLRVAKIFYGSRGRTASPNEIRFTYANRRSRPESSNIGGISFSRTRILNKIEVYAEGNLYRTYTLKHKINTLAYQTVESIQESNGRNGKLPPIIFDYGETSDGVRKVERDISGTGLDPNQKNANTITGDFDGDGKMDVVFYDKQPKELLYMLNNLQKSTTINGRRVYSVGKFDMVIIRNALNLSNQVMDRQAVTLIKDSYTSGNESTVTFETLKLETAGFAQAQSTKEWKAPAARNQIFCGEDSNRRTPKNFVSGDFNGDGLTDVMAIVLPYSETFCRETSNCNNNFAQTDIATVANSASDVTGRDTVPSTSAIADSTIETVEAQESAASEVALIPIDDCCECNSVTRNQARAFFIDLDRRKVSGFASFSGELGSNAKKSDPMFAADFNGDGKSELIHISEGMIDVYELGAGGVLSKIHTTTDDLITKEKPYLPGDYNGDGKFDIIFPINNFSKQWFSLLSNGIEFESSEIDINLEYRERYVTNVRVNEVNFISQDFNGDGKTDVLRHDISTFLPGKRDNFRETESLRLYKNIFNVRRGTAYFDDPFVETWRAPQRETFGIPIFLDTESTNQNLEYAYISNKSIGSWVFEKDNRIDNRLDKITNNGVVTAIEYSEISVASDTYASIESNDFRNKQVYPYLDISNAPSMKIVAGMTRQGSGVTQKQQFRYTRLVSHATGLGFMGFTRMSRSNWFGDGVTQLWNSTIYDPLLRGAPLVEVSANNFENLSSSYISRTDFNYTTKELPNGTFINVPETITIDDNLKNFKTTQSFVYDTYYNPKTTTISHRDGSTVTEFDYFNRTVALNQNYHVGRPKKKTVRNTINGNTFLNEEEYTYFKNLPKTVRRRGKGTEWVTETYVRDLFGNVLSKALSATGETTRTESFTYDESGRYISASKDIEGLESVFDYYTDGTGNLRKATDPYNLTTSYTYDGWNRPKTETDYLGKVVSMSYTNTAGGGFETFTNFPQGNDIRETYNALGWLIGKLTLSLNNKWIATRYSYDAAGRQIRAYEPFFTTDSGNLYSSTNYDEYGRPIDIISYTGEVQNITYDGLTVTVNDGSKTVKTISDTFGNIIQMTDPGGTVNYSYYGNSTLKIADYGGQVVETFIDGWGRKTKLIDPSAGTYGYKYNLYGELTEESTPKGVTVYDLDGFGKITTKTVTGDETDWSISYGYNADKLLASITGTDAKNDRSYSYKYDYDSNKRPILVTETNPAARFEKSTTYDAFGRPERETFVSRNLGDATNVTVSTRNAYDTSSGLLEQIFDDANNQQLWKLNAHDARGQATRIVLGNGYRQDRDFDAYGLPKTVRDLKGSGDTQLDALRLDYSFDAQRMVLDNRKNIDFDLTEVFGHDNLDRLTTITGSTTRTHEYDKLGRIELNTQLGEYSYDSTKKYQLGGMALNESGGTYYQGRERREITYNAFKKPTEIFVEGQDRVSYGYNPMMARSHAWYGGLEENVEERRFSKHYSAISPVEMIEDRETGETKIVTYIGGSTYSASVAHIKTKNNTVNGYHYLHRDYLGSIMAITNGAGTLVEQTHFGAWGTVDAHLKEGAKADFGYDSLLGRGYTGHEHFVSVGLIHMNGRMYDAQIGRFLSPDNFVSDPYSTQGFDRYGYVLNNPLLYGDPNGEEPIAAILIGAAISVLINGINNSINGEAFFRGWGKSAFIGAIGGAFSAGIGEFANGVLSATGNSLAQISFQAGAHALVGGAMTAAQGGNFWSGALSGLAGSAVGSASGAIIGDAGGFWPGAGTVVAGGLAGGIGSSIAGGNFWDGVRNGTISAALNHVAHRIQRAGAEWFSNKKSAYDYAIEESNIADNIEREVSGLALENGDYLVLDPSDNTRTRSYNDQLKSRVVNGEREIKFEGSWYRIRGSFHTHPSGSNKIDPVGVSSSDLKLMIGSLKNIQMSILHSGNEWLLSPGNQYINTNINIGYNLKNLGSW